MSNPRRILQTLDGCLTGPAEVTLFGRAALALGFKESPARFHATQDVDAILPLPWLAAQDENIDFWLAQQQTNRVLESEGLYLTHLFREVEVIVRPEWLEQRVRLALGLPKLTVFRPATLDLILTKMMRGDDKDLEDILFLLGQETISTAALEVAFEQARVPDVEEIRKLFLAAQPKVLALARALDNRR